MVRFTPSELTELADGLFTAKVFIEDALALERAGEASGFKPGALRKNLREINRALSALDSDDVQEAA